MNDHPERLVNCIECRYDFTVPISLNQFEAIKRGLDVIHKLTESQLNLVISGVCEDCWDDNTGRAA